ncbi:NADP-dependent oxidoreductase [Rossellomorea sp. BNER]|uniref:NADP-dependent oxidoreductase n=1 Tax=Rossellomorea sp. BNER TaxID=2962031 RepID=UPI003AF2ECF2|nr:NADP-dependent oxidoreductase [Rossellomorea sp. BNER]
MIPNSQKQILLSSRPEGVPANRNFKFIDTSIPKPNENEILIRTLYLSVDPYMRGRMQNVKSYVEPFQLNEVITGGVIGEVVESKSDEFQQGDIVTGMAGWQEYSVVHKNTVRKVNPEHGPVTTSLGILGLTGLTAYFGLMEIGAPKEGETVVVSGAAGAVGSVVGQIAKLKGCRVVGICGTDEKVQYLVNDLGFDTAINYKTTENLYNDLEKACPNGVDIYFDNVGGPISDAVLNFINHNARIPVCGAISSYNRTDNDLGPRVQTKLIKSSALMKGFVVNDYASQFKEGALHLGQWLQQGKLTYEETIVEGFEMIPDAFIGLFEGKNLGKQLVKVADPQDNK